MASPANPASTDQRLVAAALAEFSEHGYAGTDSNRIARRAGFAPQTFYRWYADKTAIFVAAYRLWADEESAALQALATQRASASRLAQAIVDHHHRHLHFRRSLRLLALEQDTVRSARADSRRLQIDALRGERPASAAVLAVLAVQLLQLERLADAVADGEFEDLGVEPRAALKAMAALIDSLRGA